MSPSPSTSMAALAVPLSRNDRSCKLGIPPKIGPQRVDSAPRSASFVPKALSDPMDAQLITTSSVGPGGSRSHQKKSNMPAWTLVIQHDLRIHSIMCQTLLIVQIRVFCCTIKFRSFLYTGGKVSLVLVIDVLVDTNVKIKYQMGGSCIEVLML
ncbi:hypothetical protein P3L10_024845 [Capsicum annuum]|uniref:uncharacterized protein LOC107840453 n=1 Tax=Capsicum annuum TaxID=4072 RepID=UPI0007BEC6B5|nr:uncharacterized protein LOC107840453 [Capsicum annuum]